MDSSTHNCNPNKTSIYFSKVGKLLTIGGLPGCVSWYESSNKPVYKYIQTCVTVLVLLSVANEVGAIFTQTNLTEKQRADMTLVSFSQPLLTSYYFIIRYYKGNVKDVLYTLCVSLKKVYNDPEVERRMIRHSTVYSMAFVMNICSAMLSYGYQGVVQAIRTDGTFVAVVTAWPDVQDKSAVANVGRIVCYLLWWLATARAMAALLFVVIMSGCLGYQYRNLQSYFNSLNDIFDVDQAGETEMAEEKYEDALKVGIQMHAETMWCTSECQIIAGFVYSGQIALNVVVLAMLLVQATHADRSFGQTCTILSTGVAMLLNTGMLMWNAGNITVEATLLPTAMYSSGWQHCQGMRSRRVRQLLVLAMSQAQRHVVIRSFGIMEVSYQAYVSIVKSSYSAFSILY
ncbi:uncharacterized protein LOC112050978 [Bicyclus anynana]|uniref:Odorant receptor n=1 Tax=Bicyclus anynana TaxID=110368 RepID=A0ABM3LNS9_BICAN|nr:uncharacterized protein LOC112050978 [Bicyclus anynana]